MRGLSLAEDGNVIGAGVDVDIQDTDVAEWIGIVVNPVEANANAGIPVTPPPHVGPVLPPPATR